MKLVCALLFLTGALAVSQPGYQGQFVTAQALQAPQYQQLQYQPQYQQVQYQPEQFRQLTQEEFLATYAQQPPAAVHENQPEPVQYQAAPQARNTQPLLGAVDRQIQKAAHHIAGPVYASQIQALQLQERHAQAQAQVQRNALRLATAPRAQPLQYQRALQQAPKVPQQQLAAQDQPEHYNSNPSYQFGFDVKDDLYTNYQNRKEQRDGDKITGSYSVVDSDGYIRTVTYTADPKEGFKADVQRKPTDIVVKIPTPAPQVEAHPQPAQQIQYRQPQPQPQPQYIEVAAPVSAAAQGDKQRYVYQFQ